MFEIIYQVGNPVINEKFENLDDLNEYVTDLGYYSVELDDFKNNKVVMDKITIVKK